MGIRFNCQSCNHALNVKDFLAGKRGKCPHCGGSFRIPMQDAIVDPVSANTSTNEPLPERTKDSAVVPADVPPATELPTSFALPADARWLVRPPSGGEYGPASTKMLEDWIAEHRVTPDTHLWFEGQEDWKLARELFPESFPHAAIAAPPPPEPKVSLPTSMDIAKEASRGSVAAAKAAVINKRRRQQVRLWYVFGLLAALVVTLVIALVVVLFR